MVTDKEAAAAYRLLADYAQDKFEESCPGRQSAVASSYRGKADELDPPTPQWPDGLYCWRYDDAMVTYVRRFGGEWLDGYGMPDVQMIPPKGVTRVRVLGDDEIAVKRAAYLDDWEISQTRLYGGELRSCGNACHLAAAQLVENYADALEAEAGDN